MEWLRKIKSGAVYVDILLVLGAIVAIIGLGVFVRMRSGPVPNAPAPATPVNLSSQHIESIDENNKTLSTADSPAIESRIPDTSPPLQVRPEQLTPKPNITEPLIDTVIAPICDEIKKLQLIDTYDQAVADENSNYQQRQNDEIERQLDNLLEPVYNLANDLLGQNLEILEQLHDQLVSDLAAINCNL